MSEKLKILVVDDEEAMREVLGMRLADWGYEVEVARNGLEGSRLAESFRPQIVITDVVMPELSGLELLEKLKAGEDDREVILITAHAAVDVAVEAMKSGARDFITKPLDYSKLRSILDAVSGDFKRRDETRKLMSDLKKGAGFGDFVGQSEAMREAYELIQSMAETDASILITGESGTGKELAARTIHQLSKRAAGPFVAVNTAAIPADLMESEIFGHEKGAFTGASDMRAGCFELADQGTLLLDEIGEMPSALQPKLLRILEDGKVRRLGGKEEFQFDVRVLTSTNRDPLEAVESGRLRQDLYYRINVFNIHLPPLRQRSGDVTLLAQHFVRLFNQKHGADVQALREDAVRTLEQYSWPGNVRELRNVMERAVVLAGRNWIERHHLPPYVLNPPAQEKGDLVFPEGLTAAEAEKALILATLERVDNNKAEAARQLGLDVKTIRNKLKSYGMT